MICCPFLLSSGRPSWRPWSVTLSVSSQSDSRRSLWSKPQRWSVGDQSENMHNHTHTHEGQVHTITNCISLSPAENAPSVARPKLVSTELSLEIRPTITTFLPTVDTEWVYTHTHLHSSAVNGNKLLNLKNKRSSDWSKPVSIFMINVTMTDGK